MWMAASSTTRPSGWRCRSRHGLARGRGAGPPGVAAAPGRRRLDPAGGRRVRVRGSGRDRVPIDAAARGGRDAPSLPRELKRIASTLIDTARSKELAILLEEHPDVADRIVVPRRRFPAAGSPLFAFLGFFEQEFRVFDFNLGMYDALADAVRRGSGSGARSRRGRACKSLLAEGGDGNGSRACARCTRAPRKRTACRGDELADFRALLQVSLDQLYDVPCGRFRAVRVDQPHCDLAAAATRSARAGRVAERTAEWRRQTGRAGAGVLDAPARGLRVSLRGHRRSARPRRPRRGTHPEGAGRAGHEFARAQPGPDRGPVTFAAKLAADSVAYSAPDRTLHLTMGPTESEIGYTRGFGDSTWMPPGFRLTAALAFRGLEGALTSGDTAPFAALLVGGLELQPRRNVREQLRLGLRAGWMFSGEDGSGAGPATTGRGRVRLHAPGRTGGRGVHAPGALSGPGGGEWFPGIGRKSNRWVLAP